jgi:importin-7
MRTLTNSEVKVKSYKIHLMEMVINAIYYNPVRSSNMPPFYPESLLLMLCHKVLTLHVLESKGWTNKFFSLWFSSIESFTRVHDKTLSIAAIVALLTLSTDQVPVSVQQGWPRLLQVGFRSCPGLLNTYVVVAGYRPTIPDIAGCGEE